MAAFGGERATKRQAVERWNGAYVRVSTDMRMQVERDALQPVLVTKRGRINRSLADLLDLMRLFEQHGVKFVSLRDNNDTSGPVVRFALQILGAIAEPERAITAERVVEDTELRAPSGAGGRVASLRMDGGLRTVSSRSSPIGHTRPRILAVKSRLD